MIILRALAQNKEAAAEAFTHRIDVTFVDQSGNRVTVTDPLRLMYDYGHFADGGTAFGQAYSAAADGLRDSGTIGGPGGENVLTLKLADRVVNGGRDDMGGATDGLAHTLGEYHMKDLHWAAASNSTADEDGGTLGWVDPTKDQLIHLTNIQLTDVVGKVIDRGPVGAAFLSKAAHFEAGEISKGTRVLPTVGADHSWVNRAVRFDQVVMKAGDMNRVDDFAHAQERQKLVVGFLNDVTSLVDVNPVAGIAAHHLAGAMGAAVVLLPSGDELAANSAQAHAIIENGLSAAIVKGYADHGHINLAGARAYGLVGEDGKLDSYSTLGPLARTRYEEWMANDPAPQAVLGVVLPSTFDG